MALAAAAGAVAVVAAAVAAVDIHDCWYVCIGDDCGGDGYA